MKSMSSSGIVASLSFGPGLVALRTPPGPAPVGCSVTAMAHPCRRAPVEPDASVPVEFERPFEHPEELSSGDLVLRAGTAHFTEDATTAMWVLTKI